MLIMWFIRNRLRDGSKRNALFFPKKMCPKKCTHAPVFRIGPVSPCQKELLSTKLTRRNVNDTDNVMFLGLRDFLNCHNFMSTTTFSPYCGSRRLSTLKYWNTGFSRHWNTGLVSSGVSLTSWGEGAYLAFVGRPSSDGVTRKIPYGVDVLLHPPASHPIFFYWVG